MPCADKEAASRTPAIGLIIKPVAPLKSPLIPPINPFYLNPSSGFMNTPVTPVIRPVPMD